jgi:propanediol dehydratase small subunit
VTEPTLHADTSLRITTDDLSLSLVADDACGPAGTAEGPVGPPPVQPTGSGRHIAVATHTAAGDPSAITAARFEELGADDVRIHPDTLLEQARTAELAGNPQLADSLRLAAELSVLPEPELLGLYDLLRPGRAGLDALAEAVRVLDGLELHRAAAVFREAMHWYAARGLGPVN